MADVTNILGQIEDGDPSAAEKLLPLVYEELRKLAAARMVHESPDHTLQATALVHAAYIRLVDTDQAQHWDSRGHFFAAAAEAMRRILVNHARGKARLKRGGDRARVALDRIDIVDRHSPETLLMIDEALSTLSEQDADAAELVKLRYFAGYSVDEIAELIGMSRSSAYGLWEYAKAWLRCQLGEDRSSHS
jgi:RNA polymerase sigma factor (TIGR02999 family)